MILIRQLRWDAWNISHILERHNMTPERVEEACHADASDIKVELTHDKRLLVLAPLADGFLIAVVLAPEGDGIYYPVTARQTKRQERRRYAEWKASQVNEQARGSDDPKDEPHP